MVNYAVVAGLHGGEEMISWLPSLRQRVGVMPDRWTEVPSGDFFTLRLGVEKLMNIYFEEKSGRWSARLLGEELVRAIGANLGWLLERPVRVVVVNPDHYHYFEARLYRRATGSWDAVTNSNENFGAEADSEVSLLGWRQGNG